MTEKKSYIKASNMEERKVTSYGHFMRKYEKNVRMKSNGHKSDGKRGRPWEKR